MRLFSTTHSFQDDPVFCDIFLDVKNLSYSLQISTAHAMQGNSFDSLDKLMSSHLFRQWGFEHLTPNAETLHKIAVFVIKQSLAFNLPLLENKAEA